MFRFSLSLLNNSKKQKKIYRGFLARHKGGFRTLGWTSKERQLQRFEVFLKIGDMSGRSILDVGCGLGDLYAFLNSVGTSASYNGIDILPEFITHCRTRFPSASFECKNILFEKSKNFDFVLASGTFAYGDQHFFEELTKRCFSLCNKAFGFNIFCAENGGTMFYIQKNTVLEIVGRLKPARIEIIDGYLPDDYTVFVYKT